jgi:hypothetical protein
MDGDGYQSAMCNPNQANGGDCNDTNPMINPGAEEVCGNVVDDDCRGGDLPCLPNCNDLDGDGFGQGAGCLGLDCNDMNSLINPWMTEICGDGVDQNCDMVDLECVLNCEDRDRDGFGVGEGCLGMDCNDMDPNMNPAAIEIIGDGLDQDCDGRDLIELSACMDQDRDGYGQGTQCLGADCNDSDPRIHSGRLEICGNGIDDDCSRGDLVCVTQQEGDCIDVDMDGHGQGACLRSSYDCDDTNRDVNPYQEEVCNGIDDDCDMKTDECPNQNQVCSPNGQCIGRAGSPCNNNSDCSSDLGLVCDNERRQCRVDVGNGCVESEDCVSTAECAEIAGCGAGKRCYQKQGGDCDIACDCTGQFLCNSQNNICVECMANGSCAGDICTEGGYCATDYVVGGMGTSALLQFLAIIEDCYSTYRGVSQVEGCGRVTLENYLEDFDGNQVSNIPRADDSEEIVCENNGNVETSFDRPAYDNLKEIFGCGLFDVWNIAWDNNLDAGSDICVYYAPSKSGFVFPPFTRTNVIVVDSCSLSIIE